MMFQKLESASIKLPSPQCCVIGVIALPIDTDHFFKLNWIIFPWLSSCFGWRWYKIKPENHRTVFFLIDRGKILYNFNYCSSRYFVSHASNAPLPFKSTLSRFPVLDIVRIRTRWARCQRVTLKFTYKWKVPTWTLVPTQKTRFSSNLIFEFTMRSSSCKFSFASEFQRKRWRRAHLVLIRTVSRG